MDVMDDLIAVKTMKDGTQTLVWLNKIQTIQEMFEFVDRFAPHLSLATRIQYRVIWAWQETHDEPYEVFVETICNNSPLTIWFTSQYRPDEQAVWIELSARLYPEKETEESNEVR